MSQQVVDLQQGDIPAANLQATAPGNIEEDIQAAQPVDTQEGENEDGDAPSPLSIRNEEKEEGNEDEEKEKEEEEKDIPTPPPIENPDPTPLTCTACLDPYPPTSTLRIHGDTLCTTCFTTGYHGQFLAAAQDETQWPVRYGGAAIAIEDVAACFDESFVREYQRLSVVNGVPGARRVFCAHRRRVAGVGAGGKGKGKGKKQWVKCGTFLGSAGEEKGEEEEEEEGGEEEVQKKEDVVRCETCKSKTCLLCRGKMHPSTPHTCVKPAKAKEVDFWDGQVRGKDYQKCPGCQMGYAFLDACNHMQCLMNYCRVHFCFLCGGFAKPGDGTQHWSLGKPCALYNRAGENAQFDLPAFQFSPAFYASVKQMYDAKILAYGTYLDHMVDLASAAGDEFLETKLSEARRGWTAFRRSLAFKWTKYYAEQADELHAELQVQVPGWDLSMNTAPEWCRVVHDFLLAVSRELQNLGIHIWEAEEGAIGDYVDAPMPALDAMCALDFPLPHEFRGQWTLRRMVEHFTNAKNGIFITPGYD